MSSAFSLTTPDPRFDPHAPVIVNGFRFEPGVRPYVPGDPRGAEALQIDDDALRERFRREDTEVRAFVSGAVIGVTVSLLAWAALLGIGGCFG
ncbi:hypothetical protein [Croceibacterium aestuarii]|uniref:hypothetical protein n=1 Tax=Croceibacterium aestuarii TaxID=3064139 RepID=UPI00272E19DE|nr:hypothetical protein [Croceibacterium sp. D39]